MKIGFLGDTHGNIDAARFMLWSLKQRGVERVIQVGDFGIYTDNGGMKFAHKVNEAAIKLGLILWVVPGNHENWRVINELVGEERTKAAVYRSNIWILPRGMRWEWGGMSFVALGGAPSVDRMTRKSWDNLHKSDRPNKYWYPEEQITGADVDYVVDGGYADVMVGHDAPHGIDTIEKIIRGNPHGFHPADILYAEDGRRLMTEAFRGVSPKYFFHGHYHFPVFEAIRTQRGESCQVVGLNCEFANQSMAVLDTETGLVEHIDHQTLLFQYRKEGVTWGK